MNLRLMASIIIITLASMCQRAMAMQQDSMLIERMFNYAKAIKNKSQNSSHNKGYNYTRFMLDVEKRNFTLLAVPSMYAIANAGPRQFVNESFNIVTNYGTDEMETKELIRTTTIPHRRKAMENLQKYLMPKIYQETIIDNYIISPFARKNRNFYTYVTEKTGQGMAIVYFKPRRKNTQLVNGKAVVDFYTGRIMKCDITGEYDMVDFDLTLTMGNEYRLSLLPTKVSLNTSFSFLGNKIKGKYVSYFDVKTPSAKSDSMDIAQYMMNERPDSLTEQEKAIIGKFLKSKTHNDTIHEKRKSKLLELIGDHTINRIKSNFGSDNKGYIRINPILNPLYLGYSRRRGITYKFDIRASYMFSTESEISTRLRAGYSFKQKQLYMDIPLTWHFNKNKDGFVRLEFGNGNRIGNSMLAKHMEEITPDSITDWNNSAINDFRNNYMKLFANIDANKYVGIKGGLTMHRRKAVKPEFYKEASMRYTYHSTAPTLELRLSPWTWHGPVFTIDYERSFKGLLNSNIRYERWELNNEYIYKINKLQNLHTKIGTGFYTQKDKNGYFLDYENFRENIVAGGWNDDWSGEFELLRQETYNQSDYYIRASASYESPLLIMSWLPYIGKYMEMERIHVSALDIKNIHPYMEFGYGFTTRWFSFGVFASARQWRFDGAGIKWGIELFRKW